MKRELCELDSCILKQPCWTALLRGPRRDASCSCSGVLKTGCVLGMAQDITVCGATTDRASLDCCEDNVTHVRAACAAGYSVPWPLVVTPLDTGTLAPFVRLVNELNHRCKMVQGQTKDPKNQGSAGRKKDPAQHFRSLVEVCCRW